MSKYENMKIWKYGHLLALTYTETSHHMFSPFQHGHFFDQSKFDLVTLPGAQLGSLRPYVRERLANINKLNKNS